MKTEICKEQYVASMTAMPASSEEQNRSLKQKLSRQELSLQQCYVMIRREQVVARAVIYDELSYIGNLTLEDVEQSEADQFVGDVVKRLEDVYKRQAQDKVLELARQLAPYQGHIRVHVVPFTDLQLAIYKNCDESYAITIMRRMMYRIAQHLCEQQHCLAIVNGESIGQVASQTLESMQTINCVTTMPVIRPVACMDKVEIINVSRAIDTYDISIQPFEDCCTCLLYTSHGDVLCGNDEEGSVSCGCQSGACPYQQCRYNTGAFGSAEKSLLWTVCTLSEQL